MSDREMLTSKQACEHFQCVGPGSYLPVQSAHTQWQNCPWCEIARLKRELAWAMGAAGTGVERHAVEPTSVRASNEQLAQALRNLRDVAHREVSPRYSAALDKAFTLADIVLGEFDSEGEVSREADVGPGGGVRATHATGSVPSKPGAAEPPSDAARDVLAERERQKSVEGWTPEHDDEHNDEQLALAAACYALGSPTFWPWENRWWKLKDRRSNLVRAGALILAEIERLDRHAETKDAGECGACDKPGEHCANVHGICSRHGGRAHETNERLCKCSMRTRLVGDGCEVCNPERAADLSRDGIEDAGSSDLWDPFGNDSMRHMESADVTGGATYMVGRCIHGTKHTDSDGCPHCQR